MHRKPDGFMLTDELRKADIEAMTLVVTKALRTAIEDGRVDKDDKEAVLRFMNATMKYLGHERRPEADPVLGALMDKIGAELAVSAAMSLVKTDNGYAIPTKKRQSR